MRPTTEARIDRMLSLRDADKTIFSVELALILKAQDRDTRNACAEAVAAIPNTPGLLSHADAEAVVETCQVAHQACINTQAV